MGRLRTQIGTCSIAARDRVQKPRGLCGAHYQRHRAGADMTAPLQGTRRLRTCEVCGERYRAKTSEQRSCSRWRGHSVRHGEWPQSKIRQPKTDEQLREVWRQRRGPLRAAYEDGDAETFFAALVLTANTSAECWLWPNIKDGYPLVRWGRRDFALHRLVVEMKHGAPLGSQHAHHICATAACVNPDHLQPVTHRENIAEMSARQPYPARIRDLEEALAIHVPDHPLLHLIAVA